tara:strand:+ start:964 stop:1089 length:126 start_codon:yes stop_codon:yes gene_type:complete
LGGVVSIDEFDEHCRKRFLDIEPFPVKIGLAILMSGGKFFD